MSLSLNLERGSQQALYQQIFEQIKAQISDGRLPAKSKLPTVRQLAQNLGVTRLTVQNAYSELQTGGWVEATVGRGTFVSEHIQIQATGTNMMASSTQNLTPDAVIEDILRIDQQVGLRSMAGASPDPDLFPAEEFWSAFATLQQDLSSLMSYGSPQGDPALRVAISAQLQDRGLSLIPDDLIITTGATQGLSLIAQALAQAGDTVLVEQPTYLGLLNILKSQRLRTIGIPLDKEGPQLSLLERAVVQHRPRFLYTVSSFQNPTGQCMSVTRRQEVLALAEQHGFLIVEDDIYSRLAYDHPAPVSIKATDHSGSVVYLNSMSKVMAPGLRTGVIVAPSPLHERMLALRRATDLCGPTLIHRALASFLNNKGMKRHLRRVLPIYEKRRDAMISALQLYMPESVQWMKPAGGFCCWLTLPRSHALSNIHQIALEHGLAVAPGDVFLAQPSTRKHLRLSFGNQTTEAIRHGVELLARLIRERLEQKGHRRNEPYDWTPLV